MDQREARRPPEYILEVFADPTSIKDVVRGARRYTDCFTTLLTDPGVLHTIFFHRYFPCHRPGTLDVLDLTLPVVTNPELETLIDTRVGQLVRQLSSDSSPQGSVRGQLAVQFFEKRRKKGGGLGWFSGGKAEEEICWEIWRLEITLATPKTELGSHLLLPVYPASAANSVQSEQRFFGQCRQHCERLHSRL